MIRAEVSSITLTKLTHSQYLAKLPCGDLKMEDITSTMTFIQREVRVGVRPGLTLNLLDITIMAF